MARVVVASEGTAWRTTTINTARNAPVADRACFIDVPPLAPSTRPVGRRSALNEHLRSSRDRPSQGPSGAVECLAHPPAEGLGRNPGRRPPTVALDRFDDPLAGELGEHP